MTYVLVPFIKCPWTYVKLSHDNGTAISAGLNNYLSVLFPVQPNVITHGKTSTGKTMQNYNRTFCSQLHNAIVVIDSTELFCVLFLG